MRIQAELDRSRKVSGSSCLAYAFKMHPAIPD